MKGNALTFVLLGLVTACLAQDECSVNKPADIIFAVDISSSVGDGDFNYAKEFIKAFAGRVNISLNPEDVRIGLLTYSGQIVEQKQMNYISNNLAGFRGAVDSLTNAQTVDGTNTALVLNQAQSYLFTTVAGARVAAPDFLVLITDGGEDASAAQAAADNLADKTSITVLTIGVGIDVDSSVLTYISKSSDHAFFMTNYLNLLDYVGYFASRICKDLQPGTYGAWGQWTSCTDGAFARTRTRICSATFCEGNSKETEPCPIFPQNGDCRIYENTFNGEPKEVIISCSTPKVFPQGTCRFYRVTNGRRPEVINQDPRPVNRLSSDKTFSLSCTMVIPLTDLGEGVHTFEAYMFPDVPDGQSKVNATVPPGNVTLEFPRASHVCQENLLDDYLCGKPVQCNCTLESEGRPRGTAMWVKDGMGQPSPLVLTYDENVTEHMYTCETMSALGQAHWSSLKLETEISCNDEAAEKLP